MKDRLNSQHSNPLLVVLNLLIVAAFFAPASGKARPQDAATKMVTLEGQLVCSECWFEADRKTTAYGTPADIQCATDCAVKGVPPAVAVKEGDEFKLYLIEAGQFKQNSEEWLTYVGRWVQVSGRLTSKKDKRYLSVDELKVQPLAQENPQQTAVLGSDPELTLRDLFGVEQKLSAYRGKIVVLNFWATWCIPAARKCPIWQRFKTTMRL